jgi:hypothetical protein
MANPRPAVELLRQVLGKDVPSEYAAITTYLNEGGSIFPLVEMGARGLMKQYNLSADDAQRFSRRANSMAIYVRRQFIEQRLQHDKQVPKGAGSGLLSLVEGPSFEALFKPEFDGFCPPQALESLASPVAYLIELLRWIQDRIEPESSSEMGRLRLRDRRRDLMDLSVDYNAVHRSVSAVDIIVKVLETFIKGHESQRPATSSLEEAMFEARYPSGLPYFQDWTTLDEIARDNGLSVGSFVRAIDPAFPYFSQEQRTPALSLALTHASRLGAHQRELLTEAPAEYDETVGGQADELSHVQFYGRNFGTTGLEFKDLNQVPFFGQRTKLDTPALESLLALRGFVPVRSANVVFPSEAPGAPESERSGAVYLNAGTAPAISIIPGDTSGTYKLTPDPDTAQGLERFDRINRKLRLDQWLDLPSEEVDALLVAAIKAEARGASAVTDWRITDATLRGLGLFQSLRERYGCTAPDFAVFIDELSVYGRGETPSQFDQIFNGQGDYGDPFILDGAPFSIVPEPGEVDLTVIQLCGALRIDLKTYQYLAEAIAKAHGLDKGKLSRSNAILSSFYRMVRLPRLLGMTPAEGVLMLTLVGGEALLEGLAGVPKIDSSLSDVLSIIHIMDTCVQWCADRNFSVLWMLQQIAPLQASAVTEAERQLFDAVLNLLPGSLLTHQVLLAAGVPAPTGGNWLELLTKLVDPEGLVIASTVTEAEYLATARQELNQAVMDGLGAAYESERPAIVERMIAVLLQARDGQASVLRECLAVYMGDNAGQALNVLAWAGATVYQLLGLVLERARADLDDASRGRGDEPGPLLTLLADIRRRGAVVSTLGLSVELLQDYLAYGHKAWLGEDDPRAFTLRTLYYLTTLTHAFELGEQPASELLGYLREVNQPLYLPGSDARELAEQAATIRLAAFFGWSVQDVGECLSRIDSAPKVLKNLSQLDLLIRVRVLAMRTGMDALTIFLIGELAPSLDDESDKGKYKKAADRALLSLSETRAPRGYVAEDPGRLFTLTYVADKDEVVANKTGESIIFTVTLKKREGSPLSGVQVRGSAVLGSIEPADTDTEGKVSLVYTPGPVMGTDTPLFWVDLFEPVPGPTVNIVADLSSLEFPSRLKSPVPLQSVPFGQEVELYATLRDENRNLIKNHPVEWTFEVNREAVNKLDRLVFRPAVTRTNQDGQTRVFVTSPTGGKFDISVGVESGVKANFEPINFLPQE